MICANFLPVILACALWYGIDGDKPALAGFMALIGSSLLGTALTAYFLYVRMHEEPGKWTWRSIWWELTFSNIFALKDRVQPTIQYIPDLWAYLIKGVIPHLLIIVFINSIAAESGGKKIFWNYGSYPHTPYQVMGIICIAFVILLFVVGFMYPYIYAFLATAYEDEHRAEGKEVKDVADSDEDIVSVDEVQDEKDPNAVEVE
jgi:hypothetical protein